MLGQLTDSRVLYRCRRTVLEMLRDRGYEIGDAEIEESFEEFEPRLGDTGNNNSLNMIVKRPTGSVMTDEAGNPAGQVKEPIFVVFA